MSLPTIEKQMNRAPLLLLALLLITPACRERDVDRSGESRGNVADHADAPADGTASTAATPAARAAVDTPPPTDKPADATPQGAVGVVNSYYNALQERDYEGAYRHWVDEGAGSKQTFDEFRRGYRATSWVDVDTGQPGDVEGAAGSRYVKVPVVVSAGGSHGAELQCFTGNYTLVRSEVTGATEEQRRWRIHSADLEPCASSRQSR